MKKWLNWREIERLNAWGIRKKDDEEAAIWDQNADTWEQRTQIEGNAGERQVALMSQIGPDDHVLDVGCGTGPLTIPLAKRAKVVYALDSSPRMLATLMEKATKIGLSNIIPICGNYYNMTAGKDYPVCDIAVARHSPCQCDILQFNSVATKYCYSLWNVTPIVEDDYHSTPGTLSNQPFRKYNEPNGRLFGFNVHFNILYDTGINPELQFDIDVKEFWGETESEIIEKVFSEFSVPTNIPASLRKSVNDNIRHIDSKCYYKQVNRMSILGWKPKNRMNFRKFS